MHNGITKELLLDVAYDLDKEDDMKWFRKIIQHALDECGKLEAKIEI